jgi:PHD/YefM family antitoxin component YafN of YafNO toxin-antitoxin module
MAQVLASTEARTRLPELIDDLVSDRQQAVEVGRQRRREVVVIAASRYDEMIARMDAVRDIAWSVFATERVANPTSDPIPLEDALRRRHGGV